MMKIHQEVNDNSVFNWIKWRNYTSEFIICQVLFGV